jgi:hypothetical protein
VNAVQLWDSRPETRASFVNSFIFDIAGSASSSPISGGASQMDPGKMYDGTIKLWGLNFAYMREAIHLAKCKP